MYVRTRPSDRKRVLLVEADLPLLEAQWALVHGTSELSRFDEPGLSHDQQWAQCNKDLVAHAKNADWGLYRNTRLHMATLLHRQQRFREALQTYLEVSYIDLNGPRNMGGVFDPELVQEFPPFSKEDAFLAPAVIGWMREVAARLNLQYPEIEQVFLEMAAGQQRRLQLPVSPQAAWRTLQEEMTSNGA